MDLGNPVIPVSNAYQSADDRITSLDFDEILRADRWDTEYWAIAPVCNPDPRHGLIRNPGYGSPSHRAGSCSAVDEVVRSTEWPSS